MQKFVIDGGAPLSGTVIPAGNKNGALPILAASVLTTDEVVVRNVPRIRDVEAMLDILRGLGVRVTWQGEHEVALQADGVDAEADVQRDQAEAIRASFLLAGPLLARFGEARMPPPGGDVIGRRRLDPHLDAFRALGAQVEFGRDVTVRAPRGLRASDVFMDEPSVMGTENALLAAVRVPGRHRHRQRRLRAPRAGPRADAASRWAPRSTGSAPTCSPSMAPPTCTGARTTSRPTTSRSARSWRSPA